MHLYAQHKEYAVAIYKCCLKVFIINIYTTNI